MLTLSFKSLTTTAVFGLTAFCPTLPRVQLQQPAPSDKTLAFSVVSIKQNKLDDTRPSFDFKANGLSIRRYAPMWLLVSAFDLVEERRVVGAPAWLLNEYYDIEAKVDDADVEAFGKLSQQQQLLLLQPVFASRLNLKFHSDYRDFKVFELVIAKGGQKLEDTKFTDAAIKPIGHRNMKYEAFSMAELCLYLLSQEVQTQVVDKTGLTGRYDFTVHWSRPDELISGAPSEEPLIFTAIQEQLGLRMVPAVASTRVMVIDHIERPSEN